MFFDYHIHSNFSSDSKMPLDVICQHSLRLGLKEIAITDHLDIDYKGVDVTFELDRQSYLTALDEIKNKYTGTLIIKKGLELGLQPHILKQCEEFVGDYFDFVIGSFHTAQEKDLYDGTFFEEYSQWQAYREYLKDILFCIKNFDHYDVIGHLDVVRRYGNFPHAPELTEDKECSDIIYEILKIVIERGKGIEVNTSGFNIGSKDSPMPSKSILHLYKEMGGEILTTGSDSHTPERLGYRFKETYLMLKDMGFKYLTTFEKRKPRFIKIEV